MPLEVARDMPVSKVMMKRLILIAVIIAVVIVMTTIEFSRVWTYSGGIRHDPELGTSCAALSCHNSF